MLTQTSKMSLKDAREMLGMLRTFPSTETMQQFYLEALSILETSEAEPDRKLAEERRSAIPREFSPPEKPAVVRLESRYIHRIWVEGEYSSNDEFLKGIYSQPKVEGWTNLIWVYHNRLGPLRLEEIGGQLLAFEGPQQCLHHELLQINFRKTMEAWGEKPDWVVQYLTRLDVMLEKKAYVAMGDIMRMIILWFMGGVYVDVKILFSDARAFLEKPQVIQHRLMCVNSGRIENWAMMSHRGCAMVKEIMEKTLERMPSPEKLSQMPVNWSHPSGKYSQAHVELHEDKGVWPVLQSKYSEKVMVFESVEPTLKLENPRPLNSWNETDNVPFDWKE